MTPEPGREPSVTEGPGGEDEVVLLWELVQTARLATLAFRDAFASEALTAPEFGVLACLADGDDLTKAELARALMVRPQSIDPTVESLLSRRLVRRDGPPRRGRAAGIAITGAGTDAVARIRPLVQALNQPERTGIPARDVAPLVGHLRTIRTRLQTDQSQG